MGWQVTKRIEFDAAHRLKDYPGACARVHGHRYAIEVTIEGNELDSLEILVDFGDLSKAMEAIVGQWDHRVLLDKQDDIKDCGVAEKVFFEGNPTAENMARYVWDGMKGFLDWNVVNVRVFETPSCWVDYHE